MVEQIISCGPKVTLLRAKYPPLQPNASVGQERGYSERSDPAERPAVANPNGEQQQHVRDEQGPVRTAHDLIGPANVEPVLQGHGGAKRKVADALGDGDSAKEEFEVHVIFRCKSGQKSTQAGRRR